MQTERFSTFGSPIYVRDAILHDQKSIENIIADTVNKTMQSIAENAVPADRVAVESIIPTTRHASRQASVQEENENVKMGSPKQMSVPIQAHELRQGA
jgi:hypothetical protein